MLVFDCPKVPFLSPLRKMFASKACRASATAFPSQWHMNVISAYIGTAFLVLTAIYYFWNTCWTLRDTIWRTNDRTRPKANNRWEWTVNPLSGLLASVVAVALILAAWPQPIEAAALLVFALAQAGVLGWQDHDPESLPKDMAANLPDVAAVVVSSYALFDVRTRYLETPQSSACDICHGKSKINTFQLEHDSLHQLEAVWAVTFAAVFLSVAQELLFVVGVWSTRKNRICAFKLPRRNIWLTLLICL